MTALLMSLRFFRWNMCSSFGVPSLFNLFNDEQKLWTGKSPRRKFVSTRKTMSSKYSVTMYDCPLIWNNPTILNLGFMFFEDRTLRVSRAALHEWHVKLCVGQRRLQPLVRVISVHPVSVDLLFSLSQLVPSKADFQFLCDQFPQNKIIFSVVWFFRLNGIYFYSPNVTCELRGIYAIGMKIVRFTA